MKKRKGIGYIIEAMAALMVLFIFVLGNSPSEPATDWSSFQQEIMSQDLTLVMEKTGDADDFIRNGETGTLVTMMETLSQGRLSVSGTIENVPISTQLVGFHTIEENRTNATFDSVQDLDDQCYEDDSLEEIEPEDGNVMRSENARDDTYLYIADTDPDISGGNDEIDYDSVWVDNGTRCQFSAAEGPYYLGQFLYWGNGTGENHFDINRVYNSSNELELFLANQVVELRPALESRMNGIDTGVVVDTMAAERNNLESYDILIFRERESLGVLNSKREQLQDYLSRGSMLLMMDLKKKDFYDDPEGTPEPADNFITDTGLKWVSLGYQAPPSDPAGGSFHENPSSSELETYYTGVDGDTGPLNIGPAGNVTSSNGVRFKSSDPLLSTATGSYDRSEWNASNWNMQPVDPEDAEGYPDTACVEEGTTDNSLTEGTFQFYNYTEDSFADYSVISTDLGENESVCDKNLRALNIDRDDDGNYGDADEGPFLPGEQVVVENKSFTVSFPDEDALDDGDAAEFVYNGEGDIEAINYRSSFEDFNGKRLARMGYKEKYNPEERKLIASVVYWLSEENVQFGQQQSTRISTEAVGGVKENTFIPYKIMLRWR